MEHKERTYFTENEYDDVKGFTVLKTQDGEYHIAEKWLASDASEADSEGEASSPPENEEDVWLDYWIPESDLLSRVEEGLCEPKGTLTDEQYAAVCENVGWYTDEQEGEPVAA
jgi:hypothetical protein